MKRILTSLCALLTASVACWAGHRHWTVADGLPTDEVQQIVELPNGQMLVNCEGIFCISNGQGFDLVACDLGRTYPMADYASGYGQLWQGDSLLWLHDFYRVFLYDTRRRAFRYDIAPRLASDASLQRFARGETIDGATLQADALRCVDSLGLARQYSTLTRDRQGGLWIGTRSAGIVYLSPRPDAVETLTGSHPLIGIARSTTDRQGRIWRCHSGGVEMEEQGASRLFNVQNVEGLPYNRTSFICQLSQTDTHADDRYLLCDSLATLGYFSPTQQRFTPLSDRLPALQRFRHIVGACPIDAQWTVVYAQNGVVLLDTQADTIAPLPAASEIEHYTTKYNCMLKDGSGRLWIGTQNGLFSLVGDTLRRTEGLANHCIRSLVLDGHGHVWAGTSQGVSRITPTVVNLGPEDGIPAASTMERAACLTADGRLVFATGGVQAIVFHPDTVIRSSEPLPVVITALKVNGSAMPIADLQLSYRQNYITILFSALDYAAPSHCRYRHRLVPIEEQWSTSGGAQAMAAYTALPPGDYRFEVQAATAAGQWGALTTAAISIAPPLWLTWWAKTLYAIAATALLAAAASLYLRRRRQKLERENEERVNQLFELRDEARHQFAQAANVDATKVAANKEEEELTAKLLKVIGENIDNLDYTVDQLAADVGMSRANLYKKMSLMLGITPNDFLRNVRLKHAAHLLAETQHTVGQISLMVGFQTTRYFSQCFKQTFGVTPTEYRNGEDKS